jgi:hypothetical protein
MWVGLPYPAARLCVQVASNWHALLHLFSAAELAAACCSATESGLLLCEADFSAAPVGSQPAGPKVTASPAAAGAPGAMAPSGGDALVRRRCAHLWLDPCRGRSTPRL